MTKFEEELFNKVPCKFELTTEAEYKKSTLINHFKNWHSDEEFQELFDKYSNLNNNYEKEVIRSSKLETSNLKLIAEGTGLLSDNAMLTKKVEDLKSQLQQQALPVVPECVAEFIRCYDDIQETSMLCVMKDFVDSKYFDDFCAIPDDLEKYGRWDDMLYKAIRFGFTVEKPQLFYLKNMLTGLYLACDAEGYLETGRTVAEKFTQQEIDSMETGSYEQIEVAE